MGKQLFNSKGQAIALPESVEQAKKYRRPHYMGEVPCLVCKTRGYEGIITQKRYVSTGKCVHCALLDTLDLCSLAIREAFLVPKTRFDSHAFAIIATGTVRDINQENFDALLYASDTAFPGVAPGRLPMSPSAAAKIGSKLYIGGRPCAKKGHLGLRLVPDGECYYCEKEKELALPSPRQAAIEAGEKYYTPPEACKRCGEKALKYVASGQCRGCNPAPEASESTKMMRGSPDLIISKEDAKTFGFKVYRTGKPCIRGHTVFRYVSTSQCLGCR